MEFQSYLDYKEYIELGGTVSEKAFPNAERKAQRYLDGFTYNRIKYCNIIPPEVKEVLTEFINRMEEYASQSSDGEMISQYSNGVEQITYRRNTEEQVKANLYKIALEWLPNYLLARSVSFDARDYIQSDCNNT